MIADRMLVLGPGETARRLPRVVVGLILFGIGIALMVEGDLGLAPWDVFHKGVAEQTGWSIGSIIVITSGVVVLGFLALGERLGLGTILNAFMIGIVVDVALPLLPTPDAFASRLGFTIAGPVLIAAASGLYIGGGLGPGPRDGLMTGLAKRGIDVWKARTGVEITVLVIGLMLGGTVGVGTIWFTLGIGPMVQFFLPRLSLPPAPS
jgi:uncharacterized membrane protein YczE